MTTLQSVKIQTQEFNPPSMIIEQQKNPDGSYILGISHWTAAVFSTDEPDFKLPNNYDQVDIIYNDRTWRFKNATIKFINMPVVSRASYVITFDKAELLSNTTI